MISVIVCTYNQQDTIRRTLDSILSQECHLPIEIVVGEDCSTDGTLSVVERYREEHPGVVRIMTGQQRKGFVRNYFDCLRACQGQYIADCSGDDFWTDNHKLEKASLILETNHDVGIVHTDWQRYDETTGTLSSPGKPRFSPGIIDGRAMLADILMPVERPAIHLCTALYRSDWIRRAMEEYPWYFDADAYLCEDIQITFMLARMGKVCFLPEATLAYSSGGTSISNPDSEEKHFRFWANTTRLSFRLARDFNIQSKQLDRFFQARLHKLLMHAFRSGKPCLKADAICIEHELGIGRDRRILLAKALMLPVVWPVMRRIREFIKTRK